MAKMHKITLQLGNYDGSQKNIVFMGTLLTTRKELDFPGNETSGTQYDLYRVKKGYRVFEKRWTTGQGKKRQNYAKLSKILREDELLEDFANLANEIGIVETLDLDDEEMIQTEKTILLAVNDSSAKLLPYTLANVEELMELAHFLIEQEEIPKDIRAEFESAIGKFEDLPAIS